MRWDDLAPVIFCFMMSGAMFGCGLAAAIKLFGK